MAQIRGDLGESAHHFPATMTSEPAGGLPGLPLEQRTDKRQRELNPDPEVVPGAGCPVAPAE